MGTILVVDDDPTILVVIQASLIGAGHQVMAFDDPEQALAAIGRHRFDAAVLDVVMPGQSGYELLGELRSSSWTKNLPVLFLSALDSAPERIRGLREGADDYLGKPFEPEELVLRVDRLVERAAATAQAAEVAESGGGDGRTRLGRYEVLDLIGEGSMGTVFRGWDPKLQRVVALKTVKLDLDRHGSHSRADLVSRLLREAVMGARFSHPNIVAVFDVGDVPPSAFIAMEFVEGPSLERLLLYHERLSVQQVVHLGLQVARALAVAHDGELVHHDVKPGNVMLGPDGVVKVTDFGLANWISEMVENSGRVFGTPGFLAPEALRGEGYQKASDLFGLGAILYRCLTGLQAFPGRTIAGIVAHTLGGVVTPPSELAPHVPPELDRLILQLLARQPAERPASAREAAQRLEALVESPPPAWPRLASVPEPEPSQLELGRSRLVEVPTRSGSAAVASGGTV